MSTKALYNIRYYTVITQLMKFYV